jgi:SAM-dependent methyltransferase
VSINQAPDGESTYVLGHVDTEVRRLLLQARLYDEFTEHALRSAGLRPGMRVLDVGCGPGDVSFIAARLVGPQGSVLGVDAAPDVIDLARIRAAEQALDTVRFEPTVIANLRIEEPVDAVIGRLILMHLPDPVSALRHLAAMVRPGGLVAFCEPDTTGVYSVPDLPLWQALKDGLANVFRRAGLDPAFGGKLYMLFRRAGLGTPQLRLGAPLGRADDDDILAYAVETWRSILPLAERLGAIPDELADLGTLGQRLRDEAADGQAIVAMSTLICASTQV